MSSEKSRAYSKGYSAGRKSAWPLHRPPLPPDPIAREIIRSAQELRDAADHICATLSEDDEFALELAPKIDTFDEAMTKLGGWLADEEQVSIPSETATSKDANS